MICKLDTLRSDNKHKTCKLFILYPGARLFILQIVLVCFLSKYTQGCLLL